nr:MAG TPA: hypothetical protein [Caudoviricetes sp.]
MTDKTIIKNAHCKFFEGQTGLCNAKEFTKCNPVNCKLYTIDELSTILELQDKLKHKEQECEKLKQWKKDAENLFKTQTDNADKIINRYKHTLDEIENYVRDNSDFDKSDKLTSNTGAYDILEIIKKQRSN